PRPTLRGGWPRPPKFPSVPASHTHRPSPLEDPHRPREPIAKTSRRGEVLTCSPTGPGKPPPSSGDLPRGSDDLVPDVFEGATHPLQGLTHFRGDDPYLVRTSLGDLGKFLQIV